MSDDLISRRNVLRKIGEWSNKLSCENRFSENSKTERYRKRLEDMRNE